MIAVLNGLEPAGKMRDIIKLHNQYEDKELRCSRSILFHLFTPVKLAIMKAVYHPVHFNRIICTVMQKHIVHNTVPYLRC